MTNLENILKLEDVKKYIVHIFSVSREFSIARKERILMLVKDLY